MRQSERMWSFIIECYKRYASFDNRSHENSVEHYSRIFVQTGCFPSGPYLLSGVADWSTIYPRIVLSVLLGNEELKLSSSEVVSHRSVPRRNPKFVSVVADKRSEIFIAFSAGLPTSVQLERYFRMCPSCSMESENSIGSSSFKNYGGSKLIRAERCIVLNQNSNRINFLIQGMSRTVFYGLIGIGLIATGTVAAVVSACVWMGISPPGPTQGELVSLSNLWSKNCVSVRKVQEVSKINSDLV